MIFLPLLYFIHIIIHLTESGKWNKKEKQKMWKIISISQEFQGLLLTSNLELPWALVLCFKRLFLLPRFVIFFRVDRWFSIFSLLLFSSCWKLINVSFCTAVFSFLLSLLVVSVYLFLDPLFFLKLTSLVVLS